LEIEAYLDYREDIISKRDISLFAAQVRRINVKYAPNAAYLTGKRWTVVYHANAEEGCRNLIGILNVYWGCCFASPWGYTIN
jgi:hypothetical protein